MLPDPPPPSLRLRLDADALAGNWRTLDAMSGKASAGAAVKADAYGTGVNFAVPVLRDAGCRHFFVAHWGEVSALARHVSPQQVYVLHGPGNAAEAAYAHATGAIPVINSLHQARVWNAAAPGAPCALMLDSGINRLGVSIGELDANAIASLTVETFMSHLASADEDSAQNAAQKAAFGAAASRFSGARLSLANSAGVALGEDYAFDLTRPGLSLYGGIARRELKDRISQVAFPQVQVMQIRDICPGDSVGYNATFTAHRPMRTAIVSLGYADGFLRGWAGAGYLLGAGSRLPLLGRVSMDMVVVDIAAAPDVGPGDWLDVPYDLPTASRISGLSQYELLTLLGLRYDRAP